MSILRTLLLLFLLCPLCSIASAQTPLQPGTPIERELTPREVHAFAVSLEENNFIQLVVEQRGIDVIVKVFSPSGKSLGEFDSPNGGEGPEFVSFTAVAAGDYRVTVGPLDPKEAATGRYQIKILEVRQATDQELKTSKNLEATKTRGLTLLAEIEGAIPQIKSAQTRIKAQLQAAQLLWDVDEKRASKLLADATTGFKDLIASADPSDVLFQQSQIAQLRVEIMNALAARDPEAALSFLYSTSQFFNSVSDPRENLRSETSIELSIAEQAIRNNPNRAVQIARQSLKRGYAPNLLHTISELERQNPELAAELGNEVAAKLTNEKLLKQNEAAYMAVNLLTFARRADNRSEPANGTVHPPIVAEEKLRDLVRHIFDEASSYTQVSGPSYDQTRDNVLNMLNTLQSLSAQLDTIVPGGVAAIEKKMAELTRDIPPSSQRFLNFPLNASADSSLEAIGKMPVEVREQQYINLATNEANRGEVARARQIVNEQVTNPYQRRQALLFIEQQEVSRAMNKGKVEEALRNLTAFRDPRERAQQLAQIANQIGPGQKRAAALNLLEQARSILGPSLQAQDQDQMYAMFEIARAFSRYDVKRAFEIIDPLVDQFNELCGAARTLDGFGSAYFEGEELNLQNGNTLANIVAEMSTVLGGIAIINFDRAKATTDRIRPTEARLKVYLDIAQQTMKAEK